MWMTLSSLVDVQLLLLEIFSASGGGGALTTANTIKNISRYHIFIGLTLTINLIRQNFLRFMETRNKNE